MVWPLATALRLISVIEVIPAATKSGHSWCQRHGEFAP